MSTLNFSKGDVTFYPNFLLENQYDSKDLIYKLRSELILEQETIIMFGRPVKVPRLVGWYGDNGIIYRYAGLS